MSDTIETQITALEQALTGADSTSDSENSKKEMRMAIVKQAMSEMSTDERKEAKKAMDDEEDDTPVKKDAKKKNATDEDIKKKDASFDEENKKKDASLDDLKKANDDLKEKVASLTASNSYIVATPIIEKMLTARRNRGMPETEIIKFKSSLYGKDISEITQRHNEEKALYKQDTTFQPSNPVLVDVPFNGQENYDMLNASTDPKDVKSFEEMFG